MGKNSTIKWLDNPEAHDYPSAESYLGLGYDPKIVKNLVKGLREAPMSQFKAKDIFRASKLSLLGVSNSHVKKNLEKIEEGDALSPLLLVRTGNGGKVIIADGYHRMCAVYVFDEDAFIPCKIVGV